MRYLILAALAAFFSSAHADHVPERGIVVGVPFMVCDTRDAWDYVWDLHEAAGEEGASAALKLLTETPSNKNVGQVVCGVMRGPWMVLETVRTGWLRFGKVERWNTITKLQHQSGRFFFVMLSADGEERTPM